LHNAFIEALVAMLEDSVKRDKQTSPTPAKQDIKASRVSAEDKKKKGLIRRIFKRNENRKSKTRDK
jgi:aspartate aminotransferase-like enzyme